MNMPLYLLRIFLILILINTITFTKIMIVTMTMTAVIVPPTIAPILFTPALIVSSGDNAVETERSIHFGIVLIWHTVFHNVRGDWSPLHNVILIHASIYRRLRLLSTYAYKSECQGNMHLTKTVRL